MTTATATDASRLSNLEGRIAEQSVAIQKVQHGIRQIDDRICQTTREINGRIDQLSQEVSRRTDRLFLAMITIGAAQFGLKITFFIRNW